jgi:hypothetical protein
MRRAATISAALVVMALAGACGGGEDGQKDPQAADHGGPEATDSTVSPELRPGDAIAGADLGDAVGPAEALPTDQAKEDATELHPEAATPDEQPDLGPDAIPFSQGPYGIDPFEIAGPFVLPTIGGDWDFQKKWSGGEDSYVFVVHAPGYAYSEEIWNSPPADLLKHSPKNVHYFFLTYTSGDAAADVAGIKGRVDEAVKALPEEQAAAWTARMHYVTTAAHKLDNWVGDVVNEHSYFAFCIDRRQRLRETGLLTDIATDNKGKLRNLGFEAEHFDYEWGRDAALEGETDVTVVSLFDGETFSGNGFAEADLPAKETMAQFDTLEIDLSMGCTEAKDQNCGDWDYLAYLNACHLDDPEVCDLEIGRWITGYKRQGRWVTDVSPALVFLKEGGHTRFRYDASGQSYVMHISLRFLNRGKGMRPTSALKLWGGGPFYQDYNKGKLPIAFELPPGTKKTEIFAFITGHGFGNDAANCAEFCNHTHHFAVNGGKEYVKKHPEAGTGIGCAAKVPEGVIPNQFGTWPYGRGGWCPGWDVRPFTADVSADTKAGENVITYQGLFFGKDYEPKPIPNPNGFGASINMTSWLVFWE